MDQTPSKTNETQTKNLEKIFEKNQYTLAVFLLGILILGLGVLGFKIFNFTSGAKVEILEEEKPANNTGTVEKIVEKIIVEISGEVLKPGVYELPFGSRVNDLLTAAGGLTANANKDWVAKNLNKAAKLKDSDKIYIPSKLEQNIPEVSSSTKINLNTATQSELESLWGIGQATAQKIIDGRPYQRPEEILERKIIKSNVWEKIKDQVTSW